jgi:hypothetical protein
MARKKAKLEVLPAGLADYDGLLSRVSALLKQGRQTTVRATNAILTATYWQVGRQIVEYEQGGEVRAEYGEALLKRLGKDVSARFGRGFSHQGLYKMRAFYLGWEIFPTPSGKWQARVKCEMPPDPAADEKAQTVSALFQPAVAPVLAPDPPAALLDAFPLP